MRLADWGIVGVEGSTVFVKLGGRAASGLLRFSQRFPVKVGLICKTKLPRPPGGNKRSAGKQNKEFFFICFYNSCETIRVE